MKKMQSTKKNYEEKSIHDTSNPESKTSSRENTKGNGSEDKEEDTEVRSALSLASEVGISVEDASGPKSEMSDDFYATHASVKPSDTPRFRRCRILISECSKPMSELSDDAAVACQGIHLDGEIATDEDRRGCNLVGF